jgi:beta/gamma crystallin
MDHVILFEHRNFRGAHKHVFWPERNLNDDEDNSFNDLTSSIVVLEGQWVFYRDWHWQFVDGTLGPGIYPWVEAVGIKNDDISSLQPLYRSMTALTQAEAGDEEPRATSLEELVNA